jgi:hypothetical protein
MCASPRSEAETKTLSREIVVSGGSQNNSQNSGSSTTNQSQSTSPKVSTTQNTMAGIDNTLRMPEFQGAGSEDPEKHLFVCDMIWTAKNVQDEATKIVQLAMTFRGHALLWYMKYQTTTPAGQSRTLEEIGQALLKEFQKPKSESQYITEMKEIKKVQNETVWDYDQRFKYVMGRLTFQIPDEQHREWFIAGLLSTHSLSSDTTEGHIAARSIRNCDEVRSISYRRWHRNGTGSVTVGCTKDSVVRNNKGKGKA